MAQRIGNLKDAALAYYPLKGDAKDYTANGRDGTTEGGVIFVPGVYGYAANFRESGARVTLPLDKFPRYADRYTLASWVNLTRCAPVDSEDSATGVIAGRLGVSYRTGMLQFLFFWDSPDQPNRFKVFEGTSLMPTTSWVNVVAMFDNQTRQLRLYINGVEDAVYSLDDTLTPQDQPLLPVPFCIGANSPTSPTPDTFNGSVSDVVVMSAVLDSLSLTSMAGLMDETKVDGGSGREVSQAIAGLQPEGDTAVVSLFWFFVVSPLLLALVAIVVEVVYLTAIEDQPSEPRGLSWQSIADQIQAIVGKPARQDARAMRLGLGIPTYERVHLDIGGLGVYVHRMSGRTCGFENALNVNDTETNPDSTPPNMHVPNLILVPSWNQKPMYPFEDGFADYVTIQNAPLFSQYVDEVARVVRPGGKVGLWIDRTYFEQKIGDLARILKCTPVECTGDHLYLDEFGGNAGFPKLLLEKNV